MTRPENMQFETGKRVYLGSSFMLAFVFEFSGLEMIWSWNLAAEAIEPAIF